MVIYSSEIEAYIFYSLFLALTVGVFIYFHYSLKSKKDYIMINDEGENPFKRQIIVFIVYFILAATFLSMTIFFIV